ncbi:hypothetical protein [Cylindrospermum sp. FACHB-282]|uniref:hypothetical protein n=1 Tax=Cylindrospermum sp. FACHB-282 TaxID=2692794 RepID=UPI00168441CB|nr:hypothetical protein [Cylindrospermum sp. FACHB-282]MBD2388504.1 hypothetical protein [Cylindrospermum sp. FACHB-282]
MAIWMVTTGNSDVILKHDKTWGRLHDEASHNLECSGFGSASRINPDDKDAGYTVPARILGLVYANQSEEYYKDDLKFPLLDTYSQYLTDENIKIERIIILLTDQSQIFSSDEQRLNEFSPYWKDTCTLQPLLEWYFKNPNFTCQPEFQFLAPQQINKGVDNWDATLSLVEAKLTELDIDVNQEVYVSHQAGTPAISSAVQFVTIGKFKKVQFLVSNEYFNENYELKSKSDTVESSRYQRGMQIQKAKQLLNKGLPAAAKQILTGIADEQVIKEINEIANLFNLNNSLFHGRRFDIPSAVDRIITALDLVEIFFKQENYIQGVALLNATQETFLKVALLSQIKKIDNLTIKLSDLLSWNEDGLKLKSQQDWERNVSPFKPIDILKKLNFPAPESRQPDFSYWENYTTNKSQYYRLQRNNKQLEWLIALRPDFISWSVLDWSCKSDREKSDDLRNQLLHNLLGVSQEDAIKYLLGYEKNLINLVKQDKKNTNLVLQTYQDYVKRHFIKVLKLFGIWKEATIENQLEKQLNNIANLLL